MRMTGMRCGLLAAALVAGLGGAAGVAAEAAPPTTTVWNKYPNSLLI